MTPWPTEEGRTAPDLHTWRKYGRSGAVQRKSKRGRPRDPFWDRIVVLRHLHSKLTSSEFIAMVLKKTGKKKLPMSKPDFLRHLRRRMNADKI